MCRPHRRFAPLLPRTLPRIPQAVSTVATMKQLRPYWMYAGFNTASGKYCCNSNGYWLFEPKCNEFQYRKR